MGVYGTERNRIETDLTITYIEVDGISLFGLPNELSEKGYKGEPVKTFEVKIGVLIPNIFLIAGFRC